MAKQRIRRAMKNPRGRVGGVRRKISSIQQLHPDDYTNDPMGFICTLVCNMGVVVYCDCKSDDNWLA